MMDIFEKIKEQDKHSQRKWGRVFGLLFYFFGGCFIIEKYGIAEKCLVQKDLLSVCIIMGWLVGGVLLFLFFNRLDKIEEKAIEEDKPLSQINYLKEFFIFMTTDWKK